MNNSSLFRHRALRTLVFVVASSLAGFGSVIGTFDRSYQVTGPVDLEVLTHSGDITIRNGATGTVSIHAKIHSGNSWFMGERKPEIQELQTNPPIRQNGNSIRIDYVNLRNISIDYEITVPEQTSVRTHSGSGDQTVEGIKGNTDLESGSGDLRLERLTGDLHFQTGSGDVRGRQISGPARVKAGSGDIEIEETGAGDVDVHTGSGNITVNGINGGFRAEAGSGDIHGRGSLKSLWSIRTGMLKTHAMRAVKFTSPSTTQESHHIETRLIARVTHPAPFTPSPSITLRSNAPRPVAKSLVRFTNIAS